MGEAALATKATSQRRPTKRLTAEDIGAMLRWRAEGLTQAAIAQRLTCDQAAVNRWLQKLTDSTDTAKSFLRGQALTMAQNIVTKGRAADHVKVLEGLEVLKAHDVSPIVNVLVGMPGHAVPVPMLPTLEATFAPQITGAERKGVETLTISSGSDKSNFVNQV